MNRTFLKNLLIEGVPGIAGLAYLDAADFQFISGCKIMRLQILVGLDVKDGAFDHCFFRGCTILMHPGSVGLCAFSNCVFDDDCVFVEGGKEGGE